MFPLKNENVFQIEGNLGATTRGPVSVTCPHCRHVGSFDVAPNANSAVSYTKIVASPPGITPFFASVRICPNRSCHGLVFVIEDYQGAVVEVRPSELLDFDVSHLPPRCEVTLKEAVACHGAGAYRAAAMMVRRLLEEICEDNGAAGKSLHERLEALKTKITLPTAFFEAMSELKLLGNDAAHVEAKDYDTIGKEEAKDAIQLAKEILKALYQLKGLVSRLQARKTSSAALTS